MSATSLRHAWGKRHQSDDDVKPPLEVVRGQRRTLRITTVALSFVAVLILFGLVGFQALIVSQQSTIDDLDRQIEAASRTNQKLRLQVAELEAPDRIRTAAIAMLGMVEPEEVIPLEPISAEELTPAAGGSS